MLFWRNYRERAKNSQFYVLVDDLCQFINKTKEKYWKNLEVSRKSSTFALAIKQHANCNTKTRCHSSVGRATD